jgi:hypothetical protein
MGAENGVTASEQRLGGQPISRPRSTARGSMIARRDHSTRLPDARSPVELAGTARSIRGNQRRRDPWNPTGPTPDHTSSRHGLGRRRPRPSCAGRGRRSSDPLHGVSNASVDIRSLTVEGRPWLPSLPTTPQGT